MHGSEPCAQKLAGSTPALGTITILLNEGY
ncbi:MAG: hypothetical protein UV65_C0009G0002 [Parcubacteria group bacterium GW2011_GWF2_43_11]|nr:MAG: hypothetical protein UV65_C0009G0002 [Parcubacteria group bacterium GW2011_GWF2_43_11]